jgi:predicted RNA-binding Zn-ribbon protein involved in translation (DUF1610 family)
MIDINLPPLPEADNSNRQHGRAGFHERPCANYLSSSMTEYARHAVSIDRQRPIDMILHCPNCGLQHIDAPEDERDEPIHEGDQVTDTVVVGWDNPPHRSHLCHGCGHIWRPADVPTNGVEYITTKGKNDSPEMGVHIETEEQGYAVEALHQFLPELHTREDNKIVLTPAQLETVLRRLGWHAPCDARKGVVPLYYIGGPYFDGTWSVCETASAKVLRKFRGPEDLLQAQQYTTGDALGEAVARMTVVQQP